MQTFLLGKSLIPLSIVVESYNERGDTMPNLVTHYLMAKGVEQELPQSLQELIEQHQQSFILGTLGPDIFFYYHVFPWDNATEASYVQEIGNAMHETKIDEFFAALFQRVRLLKDRSEVISYTLGFLCHFALDLTAHPYIYAQTQTMENVGDLYEHRLLESRIDGQLIHALQHDHQLSPTFKPYQLVRFDSQQAQLLADIYQPILAKVYHKHCDVDLFKTMLLDCYTLQRILDDPYNHKRQLAQKVEQLTHRQSDALSMMIPIKNCIDDNDYLNLQHNEWQHPVTGEEKQQSFIDLFFTSMDEAERLIHGFMRYLKEQESLDGLLCQIQDRSFDTGVQWEIPMTYFKKS